MILIFFLSAAPALAARSIEDLLDFGPSNSIGVSSTGSSDGSRTGEINAGIALPRDWLLRASAGRRTVENNDETAQMGNWLLGINSDQLNAVYFEISIDEEYHKGLYSDSGVEARVYYQPIDGWLDGWVLGLIGGARSFRFVPDQSVLKRSEVTVGSSAAGFVLEKSFLKTWFGRFETQRFNYPDEVRSFNSDAAVVVVPNDTLSYAFGLPETLTRLSVGSSLPFARRHHPGLTLSLSSSKSSVDGSTSGSAVLEFSWEFTRSWSGSIASGASRTIVNGASSEPTKSGRLSLTYSWR